MFLFGNKLSKIASATSKGNGKYLMKLIKDKDQAVRLAAIDGLGEVKYTDAVGPLASFLYDPSVDVRVHCCEALAKIGDAHSKEHINNAIAREKDPKVQETMRKALLKLKSY